jgi:transcription antitermination factor NusG
MLAVPDQRQLRSDLRQLHHLIEIDAPLTVERRLEPGRRVRIKYGPMRGIEGVITQRRGGKRRLLVAVEFLQSGVSVEIDDFMVEPA